MTSTAPSAPLRVLPAPRISPPGVPLPTHAEGAAEQEGRATPYVQDALAVDFAAASDEQIFGQQATRARDLPDPRQWAAHIAQGLVEVMHGVRPPSQVMRWTSPEVYAVVARRGSRAGRRRTSTGAAHRTRVLRVHLCEPADDIVEASVVLVDGGRVRALALRLAGRDHRWVVQALQVG